MALTVTKTILRSLSTKPQLLMRQRCRKLPHLLACREYRSRASHTASLAGYSLVALVRLLVLCSTGYAHGFNSLSDYPPNIKKYMPNIGNDYGGRMRRPECALPDEHRLRRALGAPFLLGTERRGGEA